MLPKERREAYDRAALRIGMTPVYDEYGQVMVFGDMDDGEGYAVWVGRCVGVFMGWGLAGPMVLGFSGALYKAFKDVDTARRAWVNGPSMDPDWDIPQPRPPILTELVHAGNLPPSSSLITASASMHSSTSATFVSARADDSISSAIMKTPRMPLSAKSPVQPAIARSSQQQVAIRPRRAPVTGDSSAAAMSPAKPSVAPSYGGCPLPTPQTPSKCRSASRQASTFPSPSPIDTPRTATRSIATTTTSTIIVPEGRTYVVVRGDEPGVYTDKLTAVMMAGRHAGRKMRVFRSITEAEDYYAYKVSIGEAGIPAYQHEVEQ